MPCSACPAMQASTAMDVGLARTLQAGDRLPLWPAHDALFTLPASPCLGCFEAYVRPQAAQGPKGSDRPALKCITRNALQRSAECAARQCR